MLDRDGKIVYLSRYQEPAYWGTNEAQDDILRYSKKVGEEPHIIHLPARPGFPKGTLATWGNVILEPISGYELDLLAADKPLPKGIAIDFIGNFTKSAQQGLPIYRLGGGAGFVWAGSYNAQGRGTLRFAAVNASAYTPRPATPSLSGGPVEHQAAESRLSHRSLLSPCPSPVRKFREIALRFSLVTKIIVMVVPFQIRPTMLGFRNRLAGCRISVGDDKNRSHARANHASVAGVRDGSGTPRIGPWCIIRDTVWSSIKRVNYVVPVDARLKVDRDVDLEAVDAGKILSAIEGSKRLRLVILDACRDNPFASQMKRTVETKSLGRGLAQDGAERAGTLIVYAAKAWEVALDGTGRNSPFVCRSSDAQDTRAADAGNPAPVRSRQRRRDEIDAAEAAALHIRFAVRPGRFLLLEIVLAADRPRHQSLKLPRNHRSSKQKSKFMQGSAAAYACFVLRRRASLREAPLGELQNDPSTQKRLRSGSSRKPTRHVAGSAER